jgi:diacylglycerol kinase family enzyme
MAQRQGGAVVVAGGDGSISGVARQVLPAGVPLGVIPVGTFNYFAREHGIPQDVEAATRALLEAELVPVPVGCVNARPFLVNASFGLYAQSLADREAFKARLGRSRAVAMLAGLSTLVNARQQWLVELETGGERRLVRTATVFVGNNALQLQQTGIPGVKALARGRLVAVIVRPAGLWERLGLFLHGAAGMLGADDDVECLAFDTLRVTPRSPYLPRRLRVGIDGELAWLTPPLLFRRASQPLQLLRPAARPGTRDAA